MARELDNWAPAPPEVQEQAQPAPVDRALMVRHLLQPLQPFLADPENEDVAVNQPGEVWTFRHGAWCGPHPAPALTFERCLNLATAVATAADQVCTARHPLMTADLPDGGGRAEFAIPPAVPHGTVMVAIRRPPHRVPTLDDLDAVLERARPPRTGLKPHEQELLSLYRAGRFKEFLRLAVRCRLNLVISGATGAGKTYVLRALCSAIPAGERLITVESSREVQLPHHPNRVHFLWSDSAQGVATITPHELLMATLRCRPTRILMAEVRGPEAYTFVRFAMSGHPGSWTTLQAESVEMARDQLALMILGSPQGRGLPHAQIQRLLRNSIDVIVQFGCDGAGRYVDEIWYDPEGKYRARSRA
jgi:type IV secretion system protein VirB11